MIKKLLFFFTILFLLACANTAYYKAKSYDSVRTQKGTIVFVNRFFYFFPSKVNHNGAKLPQFDINCNLGNQNKFEGLRFEISTEKINGLFAHMDTLNTKEYVCSPNWNHRTLFEKMDRETAILYGRFKFKYKLHDPSSSGEKALDIYDSICFQLADNCAIRFDYRAISISALETLPLK